MKSFDSSVVAGAAYDSFSQSLTVALKAGGGVHAYTYHGVPAGVADGLFTSDSAGGYFVRNIRNRFSFTRMGWFRNDYFTNKVPKGTYFFSFELILYDSMLYNSVMEPDSEELAILKNKLLTDLTQIDLDMTIERLQAFLIKFDEALIYIDLERQEDKIYYNRLIRDINSQLQEIENLHECLK